MAHHDNLLPDTRVIEHVNSFASLCGILPGLLGLREVNRNGGGCKHLQDIIRYN